ncbi:hypothetical protein CHGG_06830 [Chaetomium globosum CBS 148.51]|uniref:Malonyl-CoA:ACP transacylase (MAT) domain-containing protein n=1 Tax=Chaetomium globosum (strain ATCC 6205 / CBS 148.51 / DSM 1962 / NBRC 6347 / NRRL 1970) TaxID=306901 RepID=Q2GYX4_CHAGB|nr:uncharacterized protein CHGG_06830 [Chaetomium globosum CBS 148.51]EAQ85577.1 hypothetical protein CHGG_06830 [Chaetomium globosum CBS 148.51]
MLFDRLSPPAAPFYNGLEVATQANPWPRVNHVRRASVNSFGFGGANAHIILENYDPAAGVAKDSIRDTSKHPATFTPFIFSAASETALEEMLQAYVVHLTEQPQFSPPDLSHTLYARRSGLGVRVALPASMSPERLACSITDYLELVRARQKHKGRLTSASIVLVDLLYAAGVEFAAVVGHSSGEIAAAYAAGMISAEEAIKIAYYRGWCLQRYVSAQGRIMAVGTSLENGSELCGLQEFDGRLYVHSGTMMGTAAHLQSLKGEYWKHNMLQPVLFAQAIEVAARMNQDAPFNMAIEVGAHPALKGPATETLAAIYEGSQPSPPIYTGTLQRGTEEDTGALSATLGFVWSRFATTIVDFIKYEAVATG